MLAIGAGIGYGAYGLAVRRFMTGFHPVYAFGVIALYTGAALVLSAQKAAERSGKVPRGADAK